MKVSYDEAKKIVEYAAKIAKDQTQFQDFMSATFQKDPQTGFAMLTEALDQYPKVLDGLKPDELENLTKFMSANSLKHSPLLKKFSPAQKEKLGIKASLQEQVLAVDTTLLNKILSEFNWEGGQCVNYDDSKDVCLDKKSEADYATNIGFQDFADEMQDKVDDLLALHKDWSENDAVAYLYNRASRYTAEWDWLDEKFEQLKKEKK